MLVVNQDQQSNISLNSVWNLVRTNHVSLFSLRQYPTMTIRSTILKETDENDIVVLSCNIKEIVHQWRYLAEDFSFCFIRLFISHVIYREKSSNVILFYRFLSLGNLFLQSSIEISMVTYKWDVYLQRHTIQIDQLH